MKPRICEVLGVEVGEEFAIPVYGTVWKKYHITESGRIVRHDGDPAGFPVGILVDMINEPERLVRARDVDDD